MATKNATQRKSPAKRKAPAKARSLSSVINEISHKTGVPATDVGKSVRSRIRDARRRDATALYKEWPSLKNHEHGNGYPDMPAKYAEKLIAGRVASLQARRSQS